MTELAYGAWLRDPQPPNDEYGEKIWTTNNSDIYHIEEYANKAKYRNNMTSKIHIIGTDGFVVICLCIVCVSLSILDSSKCVTDILWYFTSNTMP